MSLAFLGMAAALFVMTVSAGPSSALLEKTRLNPDGTPRRLTEIPEEIYQRREALQEFVSVCVFGVCPPKYWGASFCLRSCMGKIRLDARFSQILSVSYISTISKRGWGKSEARKS